jgi:RNA polymerase sigma-70 factor (ECF subfamily)
MPVDDDRQLIHLIAAGRNEAIGRLMTKYQSFVYYLALQLLGNAQDAEEVTQEVFWRVYRFAKKFRGDAKVKTWLYTIAVNEARNRLRRKGDLLKNHGNIDEHEFTDDRDPEADYLIQERSTEIQWAIDQLNPTQRMVILMYYKEDLSYQEIADILNVPMGTIKNQLFRGKKSLARILTGNHYRMKELAVDERYGR